MYKVAFEYKNGIKGICAEDGKDIVFSTRKEAEDFANHLNESVEGIPEGFFPTWKVLEVNVGNG